MPQPGMKRSSALRPVESIPWRSPTSTPRLDSIRTFTRKPFDISAIEQAYAARGFHCMQLTGTFKNPYVVRCPAEDLGDVTAEEF